MKGIYSLAWHENLDPDVRALEQVVIRHRRNLHRIPEGGFQELRTSAYIADQLGGFGLEPRTGIAGTGMVAELIGKLPGPVTLYRADMDALPVREQTGLPFASTNEGWMHACGHDVHCAVSLGVAEILAADREHVRGTVKFLYQPAEETEGGARRMIEAGVLEHPKVERAIALHVNNEHLTGNIGTNPGAISAACADFEIDVIGRGGHASHPEETIDPIVLSARLVEDAQTIISRRVGPFDTAVLSFGSIHGGTQNNIIPDCVRLTGTIRTFDPKLEKRIIETFERQITALAAASGADIQLKWTALLPAVINDPECCRQIEEAAGEVIGKPGIHLHHTTGSEDMAYFLRAVPGCFWVLGTAGDGRKPVFPNHNSRFDVDEDALILGVQIMVNLLRK